MKAYPKSEKEVVCFECGKPILYRDDLYFVANKSKMSSGEYVPIHLDCYGQTLKRNINAAKPFNLEIQKSQNQKLRKKRKVVYWIAVFLVPLIFVLGFASASLTELMGPMIAFLLPLFFLTWAEKSGYKYYNKLWKEYGRHLPKRKPEQKEKIKV